MTMDQDQEVTVHLPASLYARLERLASLSGQPLEGLIVQTLSTTIPPLPDQLPDDTRTMLRALENQDDRALVDVARSALPRRDLARMNALRERRREETLTTGESDELNRLFHEADLIMLRKAYAAVLLKWRGRPVPPPFTASTPR